MNTQTISLEEYEKRLKGHDWYYQYSDAIDGGQAYRYWSNNESELLRMAKQTPEHEELFKKTNPFNRG